MCVSVCADAASEIANKYLWLSSLHFMTLLWALCCLTCVPPLLLQSVLLAYSLWLIDGASRGSPCRLGCNTCNPMWQAVNAITDRMEGLRCRCRLLLRVSALTVTVQWSPASSERKCVYDLSKYTTFILNAILNRYYLISVGVKFSLKLLLFARIARSISLSLWLPLLWHIGVHLHRFCQAFCCHQWIARLYSIWRRQL